MKIFFYKKNILTFFIVAVKQFTKSKRFKHKVVFFYLKSNKVALSGIIRVNLKMSKTLVF